MNPEEALAIIDSACSQLQVKRSDHVRIQQAVSVLSEAISSNEEDKDEGKNQ